MSGQVATETAPARGAALTEAPGSRRAWRRQQAAWLLACCLLVFAMVVLGGVTRLTGSGLSMVGWEPIGGTLPPLGDAAWAEEFERYKQSPEFIKVNYWMAVEDFKRIFWFEWAHRVLGRSIGIVFFVPFAYFLARGRIERKMVPRYTAMFVLGGLQGLLGWYMVKSGLVDNPHVSQYRLTAHLGAAVAIYLFMLWTALGLLRDASPAARGAEIPAWLPRAALLVGVLVTVTLVSGGFVAGLKAGYAYNTFPKMGEHWVPVGLYALEPAWLSAFEDVTTVQFNHRVLAISTFAAIVALWLGVARSGAGAAVRTWANLLLLAATVQVALGIATLVLRVPVPIAASHQGGALLVLTAVSVLCHRALRPARSA